MTVLFADQVQRIHGLFGPHIPSDISIEIADWNKIKAPTAKQRSSPRKQLITGNSDPVQYPITATMADAAASQRTINNVTKDKQHITDPRTAGGHDHEPPPPKTDHRLICQLFYMISVDDKLPRSRGRRPGTGHRGAGCRRQQDRVSPGQTDRRADTTPPPAKPQTGTPPGSQTAQPHHRENHKQGHATTNKHHRDTTRKTTSGDTSGRTPAALLPGNGSDFFSVPKHVYCIISPKQVNVHQIRYVAPKHVKNNQNI